MRGVISVTPPTPSWMMERDMEAATGPLEKKQPKTLLAPCVSCEKGDVCRKKYKCLLYISQSNI